MRTAPSTIPAPRRPYPIICMTPVVGDESAAAVAAETNNRCATAERRNAVCRAGAVIAREKKGASIGRGEVDQPRAGAGLDGAAEPCVLIEGGAISAALNASLSVPTKAEQDGQR